MTQRVKNLINVILSCISTSVTGSEISNGRRGLPPTPHILPCDVESVSFSNVRGEMLAQASTRDLIGQSGKMTASDWLFGLYLLPGTAKVRKRQDLEHKQCRDWAHPSHPGINTRHLSRLIVSPTDCQYEVLCPCKYPHHCDLM